MKLLISIYFLCSDTVMSYRLDGTTCSLFPRITNNHNTCYQPRLIPQYMHLDDLKFRVCGADNVQVYFVIYIYYIYYIDYNDVIILVYHYLLDNNLNDNCDIYII